MIQVYAEGRAGMPGAAPDGSGRNSREDGDGASKVTTRRANSSPKAQRMMETVVERGNKRFFDALGLVSLLDHLQLLPYAS